MGTGGITRVDTPSLQDVIGARRPFSLPGQRAGSCDLRPWKLPQSLPGARAYCAPASAQRRAPPTQLLFPSLTEPC